MTDEPRLSLVLYKEKAHSYFNKVLTSINDQTIAHLLELVILVRDEQSWQEVDLSLVQRLGHVRYIEVGPVYRGDQAIIRVLRQLNAPYMARIEDHAYYSSDWCEAVLTAFESGDWTIVGTRMINTNPGTLWSWMSMLYAYGPWIDPPHFGEVDHLMRHNACYRLEPLLQYDDATLQNRDPAQISYHDRLHNDGARLFLSPDGSAMHLNPSRWDSAIMLRIKGGRVWAASQSARRGWSLPIRIGLALATPSFPVIRFFRRYSAILGGGRYQENRAQVLIAYCLLLIWEAVGNAVGFLWGAGTAAAWLAHHETNVFEELNASDYQQLFEGPAIST